MYVVVLDAAVYGRHEAWDLLSKGQSCALYENTDQGQIARRATLPNGTTGPICLVSCSTPLTADTIQALSPDVRHIIAAAGDTNHIEVAAAKARNITVTSAAGFDATAVAQSVLHMMLNLEHNATNLNGMAHDGECALARTISNYIGFNELSSRTIGIIGMGTSGTAVARMAHSLGMNTLVHTSGPTSIDNLTVGFRSLTELLAQSDFVSLHCKHTGAAAHYLTSELLGLMKPSAFLINTTGNSRLVDETALAQMLNNKKLRGAGVTTLHNENRSTFGKKASPLQGIASCLIYPQRAGGSRQALDHLVCRVSEIIDKIKDKAPSDTADSTATTPQRRVAQSSWNAAPR